MGCAALGRGLFLVPSSFGDSSGVGTPIILSGQPRIVRITQVSRATTSPKSHPADEAYVGVRIKPLLRLRSGMVAN